MRTEMDKETKINPRQPEEVPDKRTENPERLMNIRKREDVESLPTSKYDPACYINRLISNRPM